MKRPLYVLAALVVIFLVIDSYHGDRDTQRLVAENRQFLAERDSALRIIQEHADSARAMQPRIEWRERVVARLVTKTDTLSIQAYIQADSGQWERAYALRSQEADTLRLALSIEKRNTTEAVQMASYWQLAYIADSTRREEAEQRLAATTIALEKRTKWFHRISVVAGVDVHGQPNAVVGYRLWP